MVIFHKMTDSERRNVSQYGLYNGLCNCKTFLMCLAEREGETSKLGTQERENRVSSDKQPRLIATIWTNRIGPINHDFLPAERTRLMS